MRDTWGSLHIGITCPIYSIECDRIVTEIAATVARAAGTAESGPRWFFVRYNEDGPHLRVRFAVSDPAAASAALGRARTVFEALRASGKHPLGELREVDYEPETLRYGGATALPLAEAHFHRSTELAESVLESFSGRTRRNRLGCGLCALLVSAWALFPVPAHPAEYLERYSNGYLRLIAGAEHHAVAERQLAASASSQAAGLRDLVSTLWDALGEPDLLPSPFARFREATLGTVRELTALATRGDLCDVGGGPGTWPSDVARVCASLAHMTSNRLGLSIPDETYLAYLAQAALRGRFEQHLGREAQA